MAPGQFTATSGIRDVRVLSSKAVYGRKGLEGLWVPVNCPGEQNAGTSYLYHLWRYRWHQDKKYIPTLIIFCQIKRFFISLWVCVKSAS